MIETTMTNDVTTLTSVGNMINYLIVLFLGMLLGWIIGRAYTKKELPKEEN